MRIDEKETIDAFESLFFEDEDKEIDEDYELEMAALKKMNRLVVSISVKKL